MKNIFSFYIKRSLIFVSTLLGQKFLVLSVFAVTLLLLPNDAVTQTSDTLQTEQLQNAMENNDTIVLHSPKKATYYSMALPGLGQAYNKKYWKIPVIYTGFGVLGYFIKMNNDEYQKFYAAYNFVLNEETGTPPNDYVERYNSDENSLKELKNYYRRNKEFSIILTIGWYMMNVLDATVDAHFFNYNVSNDLSIKVSPSLIPDHKNALNSYKGVSLTINF